MPMPGLFDLGSIMNVQFDVFLKNGKPTKFKNYYDRARNNYWMVGA